MEKHGLMGHSDRFPLLSRDWDHIGCKRVSCVWNRDNGCTVPSKAVIGEDGRCEGFQPVKTLRVEGEKRE